MTFVIEKIGKYAQNTMALPNKGAPSLYAKVLVNEPKDYREPREL
jgi:hypothetical protein